MGRRRRAVRVGGAGGVGVTLVLILARPSAIRANLLAIVHHADIPATTTSTLVPALAAPLRNGYLDFERLAEELAGRR